MRGRFAARTPRRGSHEPDRSRAARRTSRDPETIRRWIPEGRPGRQVGAPARGLEDALQAATQGAWPAHAHARSGTRSKAIRLPSGPPPGSPELRVEQLHKVGRRLGRCPASPASAARRSAGDDRRRAVRPPRGPPDRALRLARQGDAFGGQRLQPAHDHRPGGGSSGDGDRDPAILRGPAGQQRHHHGHGRGGRTGRSARSTTQHHLGAQGRTVVLWPRQHGLSRPPGGLGGAPGPRRGTCPRSGGSVSSPGRLPRAADDSEGPEGDHRPPGPQPALRHQPSLPVRPGQIQADRRPAAIRVDLIALWLRDSRPLSAVR